MSYKTFYVGAGWAAGQLSLPDLPTSKADPNGVVCPFAAHIRKANTRDDPTDQGSPDDTLVRLLVRCRIPYGRPNPDPCRTEADGEERGPIFIFYQASIERKFEFLVQN